jgi:hypothetical protein
MPSNNCSGYGQTVGIACQKLPRGLDVPKAERAMQNFRKLTYLLQTEAYKGYIWKYLPRAESIGVSNTV